MTLEGQQMATELLTAAGANFFMDVYLIPVALFSTMVFLFLASRCFVRDAKRMKEGLVAVVEPGIAVATA